VGHHRLDLGRVLGRRVAPRRRRPRRAIARRRGSRGRSGPAPPVSTSPASTVARAARAASTSPRSMRCGPEWNSRPRCPPGEHAGSGSSLEDHRGARRGTRRVCRPPPAPPWPVAWTSSAASSGSSWTIGPMSLSPGMSAGSEHRAARRGRERGAAVAPDAPARGRRGDGHRPSVQRPGGAADRRRSGPAPVTCRAALSWRRRG
jgi:hypothetical protein